MVLRISLLSLCAMLFSFQATCQYWFGPKAGINYTDHVYQNTFYEDTAYNVGRDLNYQFGVAVSYSASDLYAVYGELQFERINKKITDQQTNGNIATTEMTNFFLTAPIMLRLNFGAAPFRFYVNGGPRLSLWLAGKGVLDLEEFDENGPIRNENGDPIPVEYKVKFNSSNASPTDFQSAFIAEPNRIQFGLAAGGGMMFDLLNGNRIMVDFRYNWVHSNLGTNTDRDTNLVRIDYRENLEYYHNIATLSVGYMFGFDKELRRKGKSSNKLSEKKENKIKKR